jgi:5'(3')-deoxyribonucleotidase
MDFLTLFPYIGIIVLVIINALLVIKRDITVDDSDHNLDH